MFKHVDFIVKLSYLPFQNLKYRDRTVLILPRDNKGKLLLGAKEGHYPNGIVRMIGGGIDKGEEVLEAAVRELREEAGVVIPPSDLVPLLEIEVKGTYENRTYTHTIYVYFLRLNNQDLDAGDDISDLIAMNESQYRELIDNYYSLASDNFMEYPGGKYSWGDYGKVYGFVHKVALDEVLTKKL